MTLDDVERERVAAWDADIDALMAEADRQTVAHRRDPVLAVGVLGRARCFASLRPPRSDYDARCQGRRRRLPHAGHAFTSGSRHASARCPSSTSTDSFPRVRQHLIDDLETLQEAFLAGPYADREPSRRRGTVPPGAR